MSMFSSCVEMMTAKKCLCIYLTVQRLCVSMCRGLGCFLFAMDRTLLSVICDQALHVDMVSTFAFAGIETHP